MYWTVGELEINLKIYLYWKTTGEKKTKEHKVSDLWYTWNVGAHMEFICWKGEERESGLKEIKT